MTSKFEVEVLVDFQCTFLIHVFFLVPDISYDVNFNAWIFLVLGGVDQFSYKFFYPTLLHCFTQKVKGP